MKRNVAIIVALIFSCIACYGQKIAEKELLDFLNEYREAKSFGYATNENWRSPMDSGGNWTTPEFDKKYMHRNIYARAGNFKPNIYVMKNDFALEGVEVEESESYKQYGRNNVYWIRGQETLFAKIVDGKMQNLKKPLTPNGAYVISINVGRPQIIMDGMWDSFYVLEKDVPLLLERLKRTGAEY